MAACCSVFSEPLVEKEAWRLTWPPLLSTSPYRAQENFSIDKIHIYTYKFINRNTMINASEMYLYDVSF